MNRTDVLNALSAKLGARKYLEIGVRNPGDNFDRINVGMCTGVDPAVSAPRVIRATSDEFFARSADRFDLVFVDGLHTAEQSLRDVEHALRVLNKGGAIVMHDCSPRTLDAAQPEKPAGGRPWNGEVWRTYCAMRTRRDLRCICVDCDHGMGILRRGRTAAPLLSPPAIWADLDRDRVKVLNLVSPERFAEMLEAGEV